MRNDLRSVVYQFSRFCPLECKHCYISASPRETQTLGLDLLLESLETVAKLQPGCNVGFTGGEPFAKIKYLRAAVDKAKGLGLKVSVNTSCFFAKTEQIAEKVISKIKLDYLEVSLDRYHLDFLTKDHVRNAINASKNLGLNVVLHLVEEDYESNFAGIKTFADSFDIEKSIPRLFNKLGATVDSIQDTLFQPCTYAFKVVVDENGFIYPCCRGELIGVLNSTNRPKYALGNLHDSDGFQAFESLMTSKSYRLTHKFGPGVACQSAGISTEGLSYCEACSKAKEKSGSISDKLVESLEIITA